jgi:hypothetical protein
MSDIGLGGPIVPVDVAGLDSAAREFGLLAGALRAVVSRQAGHLRALHGWMGLGHEAWVASTERTGRGASVVAAMLAEAAAVLRYLCRAVLDLRWRSGMLAARARVAGYDVGPDGTVRRIDHPLPALPPGVPPPRQRPTAAGLPPRSPAAFQAEVAGHGLAAQQDSWRTVQLDVAGLLDDACTAFAAARAGLLCILDEQARASTAPQSARRPDGGGYPLPVLAAAAAAAQLPGMRRDLWDLANHRGGVAVARSGPASDLTSAVSDEVARVVAERRLGRAARLNSASRALDRIVAAAGRVPVVAVVSVPVGRVPPLRSTGVLGRMPVADVALAGWSVQQDVAHGYSMPAAVGREGTATLAGYAAAEGSGYLVVVLGGPPASAAIVAVGVGLLVGQLAGALFDKVTHHGR